MIGSSRTEICRSVSLAEKSSRAGRLEAESPTSFPRPSYSSFLNVIHPLRQIFHPSTMSSIEGTRDRSESLTLITPPNELPSLESATSRIHLNLLPSQIRLLNVSFDQHEELTTRLEIHDRNACPEFYALSYTWGTSPLKATLACNDQPMDIGANLHEALRTLYSKPIQLKLPIWVDAICINQRDNDEKNHQVQRMGEIYKSAQEVVVWLGPAENDSDVAMDWMESVVAVLPSLPYVGKLNGLDGRLSEHGLPTLDQPLWRAIGHLFRRKWFGRLWTFQEAVLAQDMMIACGQKMVSWECLVNLAKDLNRLSMEGHCVGYEKLEPPDDGVSLVHGVDNVRRLLSESGSTFQFSSLLTYADTRLASNRHDQVYGMLGLASETFRTRILISYASELTQVFIDCTKACIEESELFILQLVAGRQRDPRLPSWCPNLSFGKGETDNYLGNHLKAGISDLGPVGGVQNRRKLNISPDNVLSVAGFRVDTIDEIVEGAYPWRRNPDLQREQQLARQTLDWESRCLELAQKTYASAPDTVPMDHLFALTSNTKGRIPAETDVTFLQSYWDILANYRQVSGNGTAAYPPEKRIPLFQDTWDQIAKTCKGRRYFSTKDGRVGVGPPETETGDTVCVFYGERMVFILRPATKDGKEGWTFHGDASVYGLMELDETSRSSRGPDEIFDMF